MRKYKSSQILQTWIVHSDVSHFLENSLRETLNHSRTSEPSSLHVYWIMIRYSGFHNCDLHLSRIIWFTLVIRYSRSHNATFSVATPYRSPVWPYPVTSRFYRATCTVASRIHSMTIPVVYHIRFFQWIWIT